jgi:hypothetical protein
VALSTPLTPKEEKGQSTDKTWPLSNFKQQYGKENKQTNQREREGGGGGGKKHPGSQPDNEGAALSLSLSGLSSSPSFSCKLKCKIIYLPVLKFLVFSCCFCSIIYLLNFVYGASSFIHHSFIHASIIIHQFIHP